TEGLDSQDSFPVIEVGVAIAADVPAGTRVENTATVNPGETHDPDESNNSDDAELTTTTSADLSVEKASPTSDANAGETITWNSTPTNNGPSASWVEDDPVTITDTVPAGVSDVEDPSVDRESGSAGWEARVDGGFPASAGD